MEFQRPRKPTDAINTNMRLRVLVGASKELLAVRSGMDFKGKNEF